ncbi:MULTISPECIES: GntR family transcriptional regulator [unclassified Roseitalea]|uniref:GntR family transcriptional regulator n=1 Tax=unclassified Roseitalea TaxID=2639107 RepID=UPI00273FED0C|nr:MULTISPECIES: GntR family transcriptional regulator [unclassified Roseitalea]
MAFVGELFYVIFLSDAQALRVEIAEQRPQMSANPRFSHFKPVSSRMTVGETVYRELRDALSVGRFDPSQILTIGAISEVFNTSHMPAREALRRLVAEGALDLGTNGSARVPAVDAERLDDITEARVLLERRATQLAAERVDDDTIAEIDRLARIHAEVGNHRDIFDMLMRNRAFHFAIYEASGSTVLPPLIESLWLQYGPYMRLLSDHLELVHSKHGHEVYTAGHSDIVDALRDHDAGRAADAIEADIRRTRREMQSALARMAG